MAEPNSGLAGINRENLLEFVNEHRTLFIIIGLLILGLILVFIAYHTLGSDTRAQSTAGTQPGYTVLPELSRPLTGGRVLGPGLRGNDPFAGPLTLTGIVRGTGGNLAIIETGNTSYVVGEGEKVGGVWTVTRIGSDFVILESGGEKRSLGFDGRPRSTVVDTGKEQGGGETSGSRP